MAKNQLTVEVEARLTVSDDTAAACQQLLTIYCDNKCGDQIKSKETCDGCVLCENGYCKRLRIKIY